MMLVTHDLGVVASRTDDIVVMYAGRIVERAPTRDLFADTRMPYTQALLDSIPRLADPSGTRLHAIAGRPPDLIHPPHGLQVRPPLPLCPGRCRESEPPLRTAASPDHLFACWFPLVNGVPTPRRPTAEPRPVPPRRSRRRAPAGGSPPSAAPASADAPVAGSSRRDHRRRPRLRSHLGRGQRRPPDAERR